MHYVCQNSNLEFLKILMAHEPNIEIDVADNWGETPLMVAVKQGNA
jgi:ankyrin repeat protein